MDSFFGVVKVVRFLLQQGARLDQWDFRAYGIPQTESDLQRALLPTRCCTVVEAGKECLTANEDRLDTARLLIDAGSELDYISVPDLMLWATDWDLETILSVVGNRDDLHWDAIQLGKLSSDWSLVFPCVDPSRFETFFELCRRFKIDLSFTQPNGKNLLHSMIEERLDELVCYLDDKHSSGVLITNGVDLCAVCDGYLTPTLKAFFVNKLDPWFTVLRQLGISVEAVAAHALGLLTGSSLEKIILEMYSDSRIGLGGSTHYSTVCWWASQRWRTGQNSELSPFEIIMLLRAAFIEACEREGCYLSESGDRGNMVTYNASSSLDSKPSTVYDPERANRDFRRRTNAQKHSQ